MDQGYRSSKGYRAALGTALGLSWEAKMRTDSVPDTTASVRSVLDAANASVSGYLAGLVSGLRFFTTSEPVLVSMLEQTIDYLHPEAPGTIGRVKKVSAYYRGLFSGLGDEVAEWGISLKGPWRRWVRSRMCGGMRPKNLSLWGAIWNSKNACRRLTPDEARECLVEHARSVSTDAVVDQSVCEEFLNAMDPMIRKVRGKIFKQLEKSGAGSDDLDEVSEIVSELSFGLSAELGTPKALGGVSGRVYAELVERGSARLPMTAEFERVNWPQEKAWDPENLLHVSQLSGIARVVEAIDDSGAVVKQWESTIDIGAIYYCGTWQEVGAATTLRMHRRNHSIWLNTVTTTIFGSFEWYGYASTWSDSYEPPRLEYDVVASHYGGDYLPIERWDRLEADRRVLIRELLDDRSWQDEVPCARVSEVYEPLKVRIVTIDELGLIVRSTLAQKLMHRALRRIPCFRLLGAAPGVLDIMQLHDTCLEEDGPAHDHWASSDFKSASDGLPLRIVRLLADRISKGMPEWFSLSLQEGLLETDLIYSGKNKLKQALREAGVPYGTSEEYPGAAIVRQKRGTLMGRKVSFPFLSLFVYGAHSVARRRLGMPVTFKGLLVNGDDRLARTSVAFDKVFWDVCSSIGFTRSVGKSYLHPTYANINSQSFVTDGGWARFVPVLRVGLIMGQKKLGDDFNPATVVNAVLDGCYTTAMEHKVMRFFLTLHKRKIRQVLGGRSLFASCSLGGLGQRRPGDSRYGTWRFNWDKKVDPRIARAYASTKLPVEYDVSNDYRHDVARPDFSYISSAVDPTGRKSKWDLNATLAEEEESHWNVFRCGLSRVNLDAASARVPEWLFRNFSVKARVSGDPRFAVLERGLLTDDLTANGLSLALECSGGVGCDLSDYNLDECRGVTKVTAWVGSLPFSLECEPDAAAWPACHVCLAPRIRPDGSFPLCGPYKYSCWTCGEEQQSQPV